jgi:tetratricopeptide (TPR) repeat protein
MIEESLEDDREDNVSWCRLHQLQAYLHLVGELAAAADRSLRLGLARARAMDDGYEEERLLCAICELAQWAPRPVAAGLELCAALDRRFAGNRALLVPVLLTRAHLTAIAGDVDGARRILATARDYTGDLHLDLAHAAVMELSGLLESLAGAHDKAERYLRQSLSVLRSARSAPDTQNTEVAIARELFEQGQVAAAERALEEVEMDDEAASLRARIAAEALHARIASVRERHDDAVAAARRAQELSTGIDDLCLSGETLFDLAVVLAKAGMAAEAAVESVNALRKFEAKGATLLAGRVREWLADLALPPGTTTG